MCRDESRFERQLSSHIRSGLLVNSDATDSGSALRPHSSWLVRGAAVRSGRVSAFADSRGLRPRPPPVVIFSNSCSAAPSPYRYLGTQTL